MKTKVETWVESADVTFDGVPMNPKTAEELECKKECLNPYNFKVVRGFSSDEIKARERFIDDLFKRMGVV